MLKKKNILIVMVVGLATVVAVAVFSLTEPQHPSPAETVTPEARASATPGPNGRVFTEAFLNIFGNFDGNRGRYVAAITPLLTPEYAPVFLEGPGAVDERIRRSSDIVAIERVSGSADREIYEVRLLTSNLAVGQEPYEDELVLRVFLTLRDSLWKVSDVQFQLNGES